MRGGKATFGILYFDVDIVIRLKVAERIHLVRPEGVCRYGVGKIMERRVVLFDPTDMPLKGVVENYSLFTEDQFM